jgi:hypothetical protein
MIVNEMLQKMLDADIIEDYSVVDFPENEITYAVKINGCWKNFKNA